MKTKSLIILMVLGSFINCKSQVNDPNVREIKETRAILNTYFYKLGESGINFKDQIIQTYENKHWSHLINPFHLGLVQNFNIKTEKDVVHFETLFKEEIEFLRNSSRKFNIKKWTQIIDKKNIFDSNTLGLSLSSPAFDKSFNYAIFYLESNEGGSLIIFKKESDGWVYFASGMAWIE